VNGGHLVRVVGPGFALVRGWQQQGIPLSIVTAAIDQKAERHQRGAGSRGRPLRIEFCADDVQELFEQWKRAVGVMPAPAPAEAAPTRRPSLAKHLERVTERLSRLLGRNDLTDVFLERVNHVIGVVASAREQARGVRGVQRDEIAAALRPLDRVLCDAARAAMTPADREALDALASGELAAYRERLAPEAWAQALQTTTDRLVRERFALPVIDPDGV